MNVYFPLWQGAGSDNAILKGSRILKDRLSEEINFVEVDNFTDKASGTINNIQNYHSIVSNLTSFNKLLTNKKPEKIFTIGGDCSIELIPVSYLYKQYGGNLSILWLDAHADLNTPDSSPSKTLHGMPVRMLLGDGNKDILSLSFSLVKPENIHFIGLRDTDPPEDDYVNDHKIDRTSEINIEEIISSSKNRVYVHIDLDVLEPSGFESVMVPTPRGVTKDALKNLVKRLKESKEVVGGSVVEFNGKNPKDAEFAAGVFRLLAS